MITGAALDELPRVADSGVELRLFLEETCCNLCRFIHMAEGNTPPEAVQIDQEVYLGVPGAFADIRIVAPGKAPYFVEVKFGYTAQRILRSFARKYGSETPGARGASKVILVADAAQHANWPEVEAALRKAMRPGLDLEVWDEDRLLAVLRERLNVSVHSISASDLTQVREAIHQAKAAFAFGADAKGDALESGLVWHFGYWRLRRLLESDGCKKSELLRPGLYRNVVVVNADLISFSSYVRDTPDEAVVRDCLTSFYSKCRYQIINAGGMLYQFVGDAAIALFGLPTCGAGQDHCASALNCALALIEIGESVSSEWQRQIDRVQTGSGVHIGIAVGDLQLMPLHPFSRTQIGVVGDAINMTSRLHRDTKTGEIVVSNTFFQQLDPQVQAGFDELGLLEARNLGTIRAWKVNLAKLRRPGAYGTRLCAGNFQAA